jgi:microsomal dipeptidase-like Zn-dependent dipeptidase
VRDAVGHAAEHAALHAFVADPEQVRTADGEGIEHTVETIRAHVDRIREVTGSNHHVGIGSDHDGFIKPTMSEVESAEDLAKLEHALRVAYPADADSLRQRASCRDPGARPARPSIS